MKNHRLPCTLLALAMLSPGWAAAQAQRDNERGRRDDKQERQTDQRSDRPGPREQQQRPQEHRRDMGRAEQRRAGPQQAHRDDARQDERGGGPNHAFQRGQRLPLEYRSRQYVVDDWRGHHLSAPPRGYHWVQSGSDYLLVAITTGIILQLLLEN
jgi:Ni/Co efflux regulator RcnB